MVAKTPKRKNREAEIKKPMPGTNATHNILTINDSKTITGKKIHIPQAATP